MFTKVLLICALAAVAQAVVEYPPGIHPALCPNYPYCDMELLARHTPEYIPIPDWELPYARMAEHELIADIDGSGFGVAGYPADVDPALCPNYPYCA